MNTLLSLNELVGKKGLLKIASHGEVKFTFLSVNPTPGLPDEVEIDGFHDAITSSTFRVRFDPGILVENKETMEVSGYYISRIF
jgi:hypothetical protein